MLAFASNSLLCRVALKSTSIDPASFTAIRIVSGALTLWLILRLRRGRLDGNWLSALALFAYAAAFSFAYVSLPAATGALLLFGAVQMTMIGHGLTRGENLRGQRLVGLALAFAGLVALLLPGLARPPLASSLLMLSAGIAWGVYSLRGRGASDPVAVTAGNFLRAVPFAAALVVSFGLPASAPIPGVEYAVISGALASGIGYVIWYAALKGLAATEAAVVQLSVPVIAALGGVALLGEPLSWRLAACAVAILGGIALVLLQPRRARSHP
jgi:drug/metabolite transporter (DMT)-like permease